MPQPARTTPPKSTLAKVSARWTLVSQLLEASVTTLSNRKPMSPLLTLLDIHTNITEVVARVAALEAGGTHSSDQASGPHARAALQDLRAQRRLHLGRQRQAVQQPSAGGRQGSVAGVRQQQLRRRLGHQDPVLEQGSERNAGQERPDHQRQDGVQDRLWTNNYLASAGFLGTP